MQDIRPDIAQHAAQRPVQGRYVSPAKRRLPAPPRDLVYRGRQRAIFYLAATPFTGPDTGQLAYQSGGQWVPMFVSSGDPGLPVASVNGTVLDVVPATWAGVKALYR